MNIATDINECEGVVCQNGGTCEDLVNDFNCACVAGYGGETCEISEWCFRIFFRLLHWFRLTG